MFCVNKVLKVTTVIILTLSLLTAFSFSLLGAAPVAEASGVQTLDSLSVGDKIVDYSWEWEHRIGPNYEDYFGGVTDSVYWIVVAEGHYSGGVRGSAGENHVTLQTEKIIARVSFDNSTNRDHATGSNRWDDSGEPNATFGARTFLNNEFYDAMGPTFKAVLLETTLPNKVYNTGAEYTTKDKVFLPSSTELGDSSHHSKHVVGADWGYYSDDASRIAQYEYTSFSGIVQDPWAYWTRSAYDGYSFETVFIQATGHIYLQHASESNTGLRPAVNLKAQTLVSKVEDGLYELVGEPEPVEVIPTNFGLYDPAEGIFHLRDASHVGFGPKNSTMQPLTGDWNGDGNYTVGLYDPDEGNFWLRTATGEVEHIRWGGRNSNRVAIAGDWNGDGSYGIGLYDHAEGRYFLNCEEVISHSHGPRGNSWIPVSGDWNGDGKHAIALYERMDGYFHTDGSGAIRFGPKGFDWTPVTGDWNGDGTYGLGLHHDGYFHLDTGEQVRYGPRGDTDWLPVTGRW